MSKHHEFAFIPSTVSVIQKIDAGEMDQSSLKQKKKKKRMKPLSDFFFFKQEEI